ncbi:glycosyltransferase family 2 protein [Flavivirga eckloniae]|uniref:Glycosyl transferase family 2 n=1 Tax=Flavivirga eckloniae TaxID=1803846 RepID=A0A2K9PNK0_9FLAO|nr:glycosyltransferase family 2 protein [Flavivirga eckloniae]AUP78167.1 glycosyl transferase family 2 [Flavivirga eckloniae]
MYFSLIICTYMRDEPLLKLLISVEKQSLYPDEILIIDGSKDDKTQELLENKNFKKLSYFKVDEKNRGLTKQRNFGINLVNEASEIICFLDDDIVLKSDYFENILKTYKIKSDALAVGGYIVNDSLWKETDNSQNKNKFYFDNWMRNEPSRFKLRRLFGLLPDAAPGFSPTFSHGRSVSFLPPSRKIYEVEQIMGGVSSYKKEVFNKLNFSTYFEGYGLYEDADFSLRLSKIGNLYLNTAAQLYHYHDDSGRPNKYKYGKMVVRNGWYVWRIKYPKPNLKARFKWNMTSLLLTIIRFSNTINTNKRKEALTEGLGRTIGWFSLIFNRPKIQK